MNHYDEAEIKNWLALLHLTGATAKQQQKILTHFPTITDFFTSNLHERQHLGLPLALQTNDEAMAKDLAWLRHSSEHHIITLYNKEYPFALKNIADPPLLLFVQGNVALLSSPQLAIVGSRNPTPEGKIHAYEFAQELSAVGLTITSGLALGIDAAAHQGALAKEGSTLAVVGTSLETVYPKRNEPLAKDILNKGGAIVSEFSYGTPARPANFPQRNRIISGLSQGVLVVEATLKSGSLITARMANEQGRDVFAIPSSIHNPLAQGCHALIKQGAKLVEKSEDIVVELSLSLKATVPYCLTLQPTSGVISKQHQLLLDHMGFTVVTPDQLVERSGLTLTEIMTTLLTLELQGWIATTHHGYIRVKA